MDGIVHHMEDMIEVSHHSYRHDIFAMVIFSTNIMLHIGLVLRHVDRHCVLTSPGSVVYMFMLLMSGVLELTPGREMGDVGETRALVGGGEELEEMGDSVSLCEDE